MIGRSLTAEIRVTDDQYVSPLHAVVAQDDGGVVWITDYGSTNGTWIRRWAGVVGMLIKLERGGAKRLYPGDAVIVGRTTLPWTRR